MNRPPLGKVCIELGLLDEAQVERILRDMEAHGHGRFGELAVGQDLLGEEDLARALAHQFHLTRLPGARLQDLHVAPDVLSLLPVSLMRSRVILPTWFDPDRRVLSLVTSDPTDLPAIQAAQRRARADRVRLFVAARSALAAALDRLLPATHDEAPSAESATLDERLQGRTGGAVVLELDLEVASALRRLERVESGRTQVVQDPEQVTSLLQAGLAERVLYRTAHRDAAVPYLPIWRRVRPGVQISEVRGFGPGRRAAVSYPAARDFFERLVRWLLCVVIGERLDDRRRVRACLALADELARQLRLPEVQRDAVVLGALMAEIDAVGRGGSDEDPTLESASGLVSRLAPPWDLPGLYEAVDRRANRPGEPDEQLRAEALFTVRQVVARPDGLGGVTDATDVLPDGIRFHPRVVTALTQVLQRRVLRAQLLTGGRRRARVVVALPDPAVLTDVEDVLEAAGFEPVAALDTDTAIARVRALQPAGVVLGTDFVDDGALRVLAEIRHDALLGDTPVVVLAPASDDPRRLRDMRLDGELRLPVEPGRLETVVRRAVGRGGDAPDRTGSATGNTGHLSVEEVVRILALGGQTAAVQLAGTDEGGMLWVVEGRLRAARLARRSGAEAWEAARRLEPARYAVTFGQRPRVEDLDNEITFGDSGRS